VSKKIETQAQELKRSVELIDKQSHLLWDKKQESIVDGNTDADDPDKMITMAKRYDGDQNASIPSGHVNARRAK